MKIFASLIFSCLFCLQFLSPALAETIAKRAIPDWVHPVAIPEHSDLGNDQHKNGLAWLLDDTQFDWDGQVRTTYYHSAVKVLSRQGLEQAATLEAEFDPETNEFALHQVRIIRDGTVLDVTDDVTLETLRREEDLDDGILDGHLTVHGNIEDVRVGDIVEVSRSWTVTNPVFEHRLTASTRLTYTIPVAAAHVRLRVPRGMDHLAFKAHGTARAPETLSTDTHEIYVWEDSNLAPVPSEKDRPYEYPLFDFLEVSGWKDWNTVRNAVLDSYRIQETLPRSYREKIAEIKEAYQSPEMRMSTALQFVQDEIRYVGIEIGAGGYVPRQPSLVVERGYGDCKDKSLLLTAVLRELGVDAAVALVNTDTGYGLPDRLPSPFRFNHAIVRAQIEDEVFWLDPTWTHSGGRGRNIVQPSYGHALVLSEKSDGLEAISRWQPSGPEIKVSEDYWFPDKPDGKIRFEVKSVFKDREADYMRRTFASSGKAEMARRYASYYSDRYPGMVPSEDLRFVDNFEHNEIRIYESYQLDLEDFARGELLSDFLIQADGVLDRLPSPRGYQRKSPIALNGPISYEHTIYLNNQVRGFAELEEVVIDNDAFSYHRTNPRNGKMAWFRWQLDIKKRTVGTDLVDAYLRDEKIASDKSYLTYDLTRYLDQVHERAEAQTLEDTAAPLDPEMELYVGYAFAALFAVAVLTYLFFALRHGLKADQDYRHNAVFFPVSAFKFLVMSTVTFGLYPFFWSLKFWFWVRRNEQAGIWPVWRAIFTIIWLFPAFRRANQRLNAMGRAALPVWLAAIAAALFLLLQFASPIVDYSGLPKADFIVMAILPLLQGLCCLPAVLAVNRCNRLMHIEYNSSWSFWNASAILIFAAISAFALLGENF